MSNQSNEQSNVNPSVSPAPAPATSKQLFERVCAEWLALNNSVQPLNLGYVHKIAHEFDCSHLASESAELFRETLKEVADSAAQLGQAGALKAGRQVSWIWEDCAVEVPRMTANNALPEFRVTPTVLAAYKHLGAARDTIVAGVKAPVVDQLIAQLSKAAPEKAPTQKQIARAFEILRSLGFVFDETEVAAAIGKGRVASDEKEA